MSAAYWAEWVWHEAGRARYRMKFPEHFARFQRLREERSENGYSLLPFDENKCIYVHVPKCAGVSVNKALLGCLGGGHITLRQYRIIFGFRDFERYFKFSFSRNPWDRLVSAFHFLKQGGYNEADANWAKKNLSACKAFDDFVKNWLNEERIYSYPHFRPQCHYLCLSKARVGVDFLGRFETLDVDFKKICDHLGVACELPKFNNSERDGYEDYYDSESKDIVYRLYFEDIKTLGYSF